MLQHIPVHDKLITKTEYGFKAELYTNSKGYAQIIVSAKGDSIDETVTKLLTLYDTLKESARGKGIDLV